MIQTLKILALSVAVSTLASCGGGGSSSGGSTEFSVLPSDWTLTAGKGNTVCAVDPADRPETTVTIVGGTAPYRIINSSPQWLDVSATTVTGKNPSFTVYSKGGCGADISVLILDSQSRSATFTFTFEAGEELDTASPI